MRASNLLARRRGQAPYGLRGPMSGMFGGSSPFNGNFLSLFPTAYQIAQTNLPGQLLYGGVPKATAGNTATSILSLSGVCAGKPVPITWKATNTANIGAGAAFNVYYDGTATTPAMTGVVPVAGTPTALTGAALGLSTTWTAGSSVINNTWKATAFGLIDQSPNFFDYSQPDSTKQPIITAGVNGTAGLLYDGIDDLLDSVCATPAPLTTPYSCLLVARRPTAAAGNARMLGRDDSALLLTAATSIQIYNGGFGPTGTGLPTNTWGAIDYTLTGTAATNIKTGSGPRVAGGGALNVSSSAKSIVGSALPANIEMLLIGYVPAADFSAAKFRAAVTSLLGGTVNV